MEVGSVPRHHLLILISGVIASACPPSPRAHTHCADHDLLARYTLTPEMARCGVASYHRDTAKFVKHLEQSFIQFRDVLGA